MKNEYTYEEVLAFADLNEFEPEQVCNLLGLLFETGRAEQDIIAIKKGLELSEKQVLEKFENHEKATFHYFVSNGWSYLQQLSQQINSNEFWAFETPLVENQVVHLRKALAIAQNFEEPLLPSQILTILEIPLIR